MRIVLSGLLMFAPASSLAQIAGTRAFTGLTLIDGTDRPPVVGATIVVRDGRVVEAGPARSVRVPAGAERVALDGKTVIPGLINAHGHVNDPNDLRTYAAYGVTTVFSLGGEQSPVFAARAEQGSPTLARARVFVSGPVLAPNTPDEARAQVRDVKAQNVDIVKIRVDDNLGTTQKMAPAVYRAVIDEAHRLGLRVAAHLFYLADAKALLAAGADLVAHSVRDRDVDAELIGALESRGVCVSPTLMREVSTFVYESTPAFFSDPLFLAHANADWVRTLQEPARQQALRASPSAQRYKAALEVAKRNVKRLADAGVPIAMGTDTGPTGRFQGYFELMELELMAQAGLTPRQVIRSATRDAARCMKVDRELGTLEPGKWADFVVLDANPYEDIRNVRRIAAVYIAGNRVPGRDMGGGRCSANAYNCADAPNPIPAPNTVWLEEMTWMDVRDAMKAGKTTIIVPTGGVEPNGPWLALGKHNYVLTANCEAIARKLGNALCAPIVKLVPEGRIEPRSGHMTSPGTISVREETFRAMLTDIVHSLRMHGFRNIILIGDSGGNQGGQRAVADSLTALWRGDPVVAHVQEYYDYPGAAMHMSARGIVDEASDNLHDDPIISLNMFAADPKSVRYDERVKAGKATINGVSIADRARATALAREIVEFRAATTVEAINRAIANKGTLPAPARR